MKIPQITFTRFVAAILIVIYHYGLPIFNFKSLDFVFEKANVGVSYFYILSGFIMMIAYGRKEYIDFGYYIKQRFARIYPVYIIGLLLAISLLGNVRPAAVVLSLLSLQSWVPGYALTLNGPGWSISVEFFFYLLFPFLFNSVYARRKNARGPAFVVCFIWLVIQVLTNWFVSSSYYHGFPSAGHDLIYYFPLIHLNEFLVGNIAGLYFLRHPGGKKNDIWILVVFIATLLGLKFIPLIVHNGLMALFFVPFIVLVAKNNGWFKRFFSFRFLQYLGDVSFGIYIYQWPVFLLVKRLVKYFSFQKMGKVTGFFVYIVFLIAIAVLSYELIEKPVKKYVSKRRGSGSDVLKS
ncbi:acyltransferase family protein [Filimonas effusa]|uniref:Acyltransferase n=1 Tax=Filimonas effusa TaxID=2508721 RepID=A0A4Q1DEE4_9BACT|nr:acyltransferase [Filimonas effusa]RXK87063.1 acyltransferase [Filimonas effusa]